MTDDKKIAQKRLAKIQDYKDTFSTPIGKRVLQDMLCRFGGLRSTAVANDPYSTYFAEGQRAVILHLFETLRLDTKDLYEHLMKGDDNGRE